MVEVTDMVFVILEGSFPQRDGNLTSAAITFEKLNPLGENLTKQRWWDLSSVEKYNKIIDAPHADREHWFSTTTLWRNWAYLRTVSLLINENAELVNAAQHTQMDLAFHEAWQDCVYVFYAGHGIATASGEAYILPYDGRPEVDLLDRTALPQKELFAEIHKVNPRNDHISDAVTRAKHAPVKLDGGC